MWRFVVAILLQQLMKSGEKPIDCSLVKSMLLT